MLYRWRSVALGGVEGLKLEDRDVAPQFCARAGMGEMTFSDDNWKTSPQVVALDGY